eukprot:scaffold684_cov345-Pavlova_lutheri.AAC.32
MEVVRGCRNPKTRGTNGERSRTKKKDGNLRVARVHATDVDGVEPGERVVFVAGATGKVGFRAVRELARRGYQVRAGVRNLEKGNRCLAYQDLPEKLAYTGQDEEMRKQWNQVSLENVRAVAFDVDRPETLADAIGDAKVVVSCLGAPESEIFDVDAPRRIDGQGTSALVRAAADLGVEHFVMVSSLGAGRFGMPASLLNAWGKVLEWKKESEDVLRRSGMKYTIVRPGGMERPTDDFGKDANLVLARADTRGGTDRRSGATSHVFDAQDVGSGGGERGAESRRDGAPGTHPSGARRRWIGRNDRVLSIQVQVRSQEGRLDGEAAGRERTIGNVPRKVEHVGHRGRLGCAIVGSRCHPGGTAGRRGRAHVRAAVDVGAGRGRCTALVEGREPRGRAAPTLRPTGRDMERSSRHVGIRICPLLGALLELACVVDLVAPVLNPTSSFPGPSVPPPPPRRATTTCDAPSFPRVRRPTAGSPRSSQHPPSARRERWTGRKDDRKHVGNTRAEHRRTRTRTWRWSSEPKCSLERNRRGRDRRGRDRRGRDRRGRDRRGRDRRGRIEGKAKGNRRESRKGGVEGRVEKGEQKREKGG